MAVNFVCNDTAANGSAIAAHCSGNSNNTGDTESNQCTIDGSAGSVERTLTLDASAADLNGYWVELDNIDSYDGAAGNWDVPLTVSSTNHNVTWDEVWICHVSSGYAAKNTLGGNTGIGKTLSSSPTNETVNQAAGVTISAGDKIIVIYAFDNGKTSAQSIGITPSFTIVGPGTVSVASVTPDVNDTVTADDSADAVKLNVLLMPNENDTVTIVDTDTDIPRVHILVMPNENDTVTASDADAGAIQLNVILAPNEFDVVTADDTDAQVVDIILMPDVNDTVAVHDGAEPSIPIMVTEFVQVELVGAAVPIEIDEGDTVTATEEAVALNVILMPSIQETLITVTEDTPVNVILGPVAGDDVSATEETVALNVILMPDEFDTVAVTEATPLNVILAPDVFEDILAEEDVTVNVVIGPGVFDTVTADDTDAQIVNVLLMPDVFEEIPVSEDITPLLPQLNVNEGDTVTVAEFPSVQVGETPSTLTIDVFDIVWLFAFTPGGADTVTVSEFQQVNVSDILDVFPATFDVVTIAEFVKLFVNTLVIDVGDDLTVSELTSLFPLRLVPNIFDTVNVVEARTLYYSLSIAQPVSVSEFFKVDISAFEDVMPALFDTLTVQEDVTVRLTVYVQAHDDINLPGQFVQPNLADTVSVEDVPLVAVVISNALPIIVFDTVTLQDTVQHLPIYAAGDDVAVVEGVTTSIPYIPVSEGDDVTLAELAQAYELLPAVASDDVAVTEGVSVIEGQLTINQNDAVLLVDGPNLIIPIQQTLSISEFDTIIVDETTFGVGPHLNIDVFDNVAATVIQPVASTHFVDGSYFSRNTELVGNTDGKKGIMSVWIKMDDLTAATLWDGTGLGAVIQFGGNFALQFSNPANSPIFAMNMSSGMPAAGQWLHFLASWDLGAGTAKFYRNDVDVTNLVSTVNDVINYTEAPYFVGAVATILTNFINGDVTELYLNFAEYIDLSIEANRRKFISAGGVAVDLGGDGSNPTGNQPIIYMTGGAGDFANNKGYGGSFTPNGTLVDGESINRVAAGQIGDFTQVNILVMPNVNEAVTVTESSGFVGPRISTFDTVTVADFGQPDVIGKPNLVDSLSISEFVQIRMTLRVSGFDSVSVAEATPSLIFVTASDLQVSVHDNVITADIPVYQLNPVLVVQSDFVSVADILAGFTGGEIPWIPVEEETGFWVPDTVSADGWTAESPDETPWENN